MMPTLQHSGFYNDLHKLVRSITGLPDLAFDRRWQQAHTKADYPWLAQTSSFNVDTCLLQTVCEEFAEFHLFDRPQVHDVFFKHQHPDGFGRHLIGREFDFRFPDGVTERVKILDVFLGARFGMGYRIESASGRRMEFEKFD